MNLFNHLLLRVILLIQRGSLGMGIVGVHPRILENIILVLLLPINSCNIVRRKVRVRNISPLCQCIWIRGTQRRALIVGNDLMTPRPGFAGLKEGCKWCLCVERWKEAMVASERLGAGVVPKWVHSSRNLSTIEPRTRIWLMDRINLQATAFDSLKRVSIDDLKKFESKP